MRQYDVVEVERLVDDYSGQDLGTYEGTTMGWTIIRNSDGQERHVNDLTKGALNVLAEAFDGIAESGGREAAYRSAVSTLQKMLDSEVQQAEEDDASALLLAQQADLVIERGNFTNFTLEEEAAAIRESTSSGKGAVVERIGEYTGSKDQPYVLGVGQRVIIFTKDKDIQLYDGKSGEIASLCSEASQYDYKVLIENGPAHPIPFFKSELTALPAI